MDKADRDTLMRMAALDVRSLGEVHGHLTGTELKLGFAAIFNGCRSR
jgi:hypothetical protein